MTLLSGGLLRKGEVYYNYRVYVDLLFVASRIGRLTGRLPKELADDVVESLLDFFRYVWHW